MNTAALILALIATVLAGRWLFRLFFEDTSDFWECVRFSLTPDLFSMFRGEFLDDLVQSMKLSLFLFLTGGAGVLTYMGTMRIGSLFME